MEAVVVIWVLCGVAGAAMLSRYGKAGTGFLLGGLLGPIGLIITWTMRDTAKLDDAKASTVHGGSTTGAALAGFSPEALTKKCPDCAETIKLEARVCRFCGYRFAEEAVSQAVESARLEHLKHEKKVSLLPENPAASGACRICGEFTLENRGSQRVRVCANCIDKPGVKELLRRDSSAAD
jgi:hypothetical protein